MKPTTAFIRIVNEDIISFLRSLDYVRSFNDTDPLPVDIDKYGIATSCINDDGYDFYKYYSIIPISSFDSTNPHVTWNFPWRMDCGYDVSKFKEVIMGFEHKNDE